MPAITTSGSTNMSSYNSRIVVIEVTGICQKLMRTSNHTFRVPYSRMALVLRQINLMGGKIVRISLTSGFFPQEQPSENHPMEPVVSAVSTTTEPIETPADEVEITEVANETVVAEVSPIVELESSAGENETIVAEVSPIVETESSAGEIEIAKVIDESVAEVSTIAELPETDLVEVTASELPTTNDISETPTVEATPAKVSSSKRGAAAKRQTTAKSKKNTKSTKSRQSKRKK